MFTADNIINFVCQALELDKDVLIIDGLKGVNKKYRDGRMITTHLLRRSVFDKEDNPITYKQIATLMKRNCHGTAMASEMACADLLKVDKAFGLKYEKVVKLMSNG